MVETPEMDLETTTLMIYVDRSCARGALGSKSSTERLTTVCSDGTNEALNSNLLVVCGWWQDEIKPPTDRILCKPY